MDVAIEMYKINNAYSDVQYFWKYNRELYKSFDIEFYLFYNMNLK